MAQLFAIRSKKEQKNYWEKQDEMPHEKNYPYPEGMDLEPSKTVGHFRSCTGKLGKDTGYGNEK
jgi:hypothetical protein